MRLFFSYNWVLHFSRSSSTFFIFSSGDLDWLYEWSLKTSSMKYDYLQFHYFYYNELNVIILWKYDYITSHFIPLCILLILVCWFWRSCSHMVRQLTKIRGINCYRWNSDLEFVFQMQINTVVLGISVVFGLLGDSNQQPVK